MKGANIEEIINLMISLLFFVYLILFTKFEIKLTKTIWFYGVLLLLLSRIFTVAESYLFESVFNILEHISIAMGALLFLISVVKKQL
jgi:SNF family Na+-dependent transporter